MQANTDVMKIYCRSKETKTTHNPKPAESKDKECTWRDQYDGHQLSPTPTYGGSKINKYTNGHMRVTPLPLPPLGFTWIWTMPIVWDSHHFAMLNEPGWQHLGQQSLQLGKQKRLYSGQLWRLWVLFKTSTHTKTGFDGKMTLWWTALASNRTSPALFDKKAPTRSVLTRRAFLQTRRTHDETTSERRRVKNCALRTRQQEVNCLNAWVTLFAYSIGCCLSQNHHLDHQVSVGENLG